MDALTLAIAMDLFQLPRTLGETPDGETIVANVGRFGPYVKYGSKYASLKEDDPYTVTLERAREVIRLKKETDAARLIRDFGEAGIQVLNGRYGPYITDKKKNARIPKDRDPKTVTLEECRALLAAAPERGRFGRWGRGKRAAAPAAKAGDGAQASPTDTAAAPGRKAARGKTRPAPAAAAAPAHTSTTAARSPPAAHAKQARAGRKAHAVPKTPAKKPAGRKPRAAPKPGTVPSRVRGAK
jgi:DNA topoisomerase-1